MKENNYNTSNLNLATFLRVKGMKLLDIKNNSIRKVFVFEDSDKLNQLVRIFNFGEDSNPELQTNARETLQTLRDFKIAIKYESSK